MACLHCGYDRTGLSDDAPCPECGGSAPSPDGLRYLDLPIHILTKASLRLAAIVALQALSLTIVLAIFTPSPAGPWLLLVGFPIAILNLFLRSGRRLHDPVRSRRPGSLIVGIILAGIGLAGTILATILVGDGLAVGLPVALALVLALGARGSVSTSEWIGDQLAEGFHEYAIWPALIGTVATSASLVTGRGGDAVVLCSLGFLVWWLIQLVGDGILAYTSVLAIGHRHKLDGIEARRRDREDEWSRDR